MHKDKNHSWMLGRSLATFPAGKKQRLLFTNTATKLVNSYHAQTDMRGHSVNQQCQHRREGCNLSTEENTGGSVQVHDIPQTGTHASLWARYQLTGLKV